MLLRDASARREARAFVLEGPRVVADALARGVELEAVYLGPAARTSFASLVSRLDAAKVPTRDLKEGVLEKIGTTRTPQPVLGIAPTPPMVPVDAISPGLVVVCAGSSRQFVGPPLLASTSSGDCSLVPQNGQ